MIKDYHHRGEIGSQGDELDRVAVYWTKQLQDQPLTQKMIRHVELSEEYSLLKSYLDLMEKKIHILDGGCGRGEWTVYLSRRGYHTVGLDISGELIGSLKQRFPKLNFQCGDLRDTGFPAQSFNLVFSWGAMEHFEMGLEPCLKETFRILKPGGLLFCSVPFANRRQLRRMDRELMHHFGLGHGTSEEQMQTVFYQWRFTRGELARELFRSGFELLRLQPIHVDEGLRRMFQHDFKWSLRPGGLIEQGWIQLFRLLIPRAWVAHMLCAVAYRRD